jgi:hypothetical protein
VESAASDDGYDESVENTGVESAAMDDDDESIENTGVHRPSTEYKWFTQAEEAGRTAALNNDNKPRTRSTAAQEFIHSMFEDMDPT